MKRIIYKENGGVSVVIPAPEARRILSINGIEVGVPIPIGRLPFSLDYLNASKIPYELEPETEWLERVFNKAQEPQYNKSGIQVNQLYNMPFEDTENILPDGRFRDAWSKGTENAVEVYLPKAKNQVMSELRIARNKELTDTDGLLARAVEIADPVEEDSLKIYRQALRDLPATIDLDSILTAEELQIKYPEIVTIDSLKIAGTL